MNNPHNPEALLMERALIRMDRPSRMIFLAHRLDGPDGLDYTEMAAAARRHPASGRATHC
jgi:hypothetical protein